MFRRLLLKFGHFFGGYMKKQILLFTAMGNMAIAASANAGQDKNLAAEQQFDAKHNLLMDINKKHNACIDDISKGKGLDNNLCVEYHDFGQQKAKILNELGMSNYFATLSKKQIEFFKKQ